jgi:hypothetical protein
MTTERTAPRDVAEVAERATDLPAGAHERFRAYGVMGLPFASGHVLGLRRFPSPRSAPGYTSVWHRTPEGDWEFWSTAAPGLSCARYAGAVSRESRRTGLRIDWPQPGRRRLAPERQKGRARRAPLLRRRVRDQPCLRRTATVWSTVTD